MEQLDNDDWEKNVDGENTSDVNPHDDISAGLLNILRLVTHHPETVLVEYKSTTQLLLKQVIPLQRNYVADTILQVKNLRSQVGRAAVHVMAAMFEQLQRSMESDLEKIALPLVLKTGETNRFLREDCNICLDRSADVSAG